MDKGEKVKGVDRRAFIRMSSGAVVAVGANWFLPRIALGADEEIRIGGLCELSGFVAPMGSEQAQGIELAVELYNRKGGVLGRKLKLIMEDTESKNDVGLAKARRLVERDKVHFLTGVIFSSVSMAIQNYTKEKKLLFVNCGSGNDALIEPPYCDRYFFKAMGSTRASSPTFREPAKRTGPKWVFMADNYSWGKLNVEVFKKALMLYRSDGQVVGEEYPNTGETNYAPHITKVMGANPDGLFIAIFGAGYSRSIKQAREMGLKCHIHHAFWSYADGLAAGDAVLGMTTTPPYIPDNPETPRAQVFADEFKAKHGRYPGYAGAAGFSGVEFIIDAVKAAGTTDVEAVIETMEGMKYKECIMGPDVYFRKADHLLVSGVYTVEIVKDPKYTYGLKRIDYEANPASFLTPEGKTGCEEAMKKRV